jgi:hypothetical protein
MAARSIARTLLFYAMDGEQALVCKAAFNCGDSIAGRLYQGESCCIIKVRRALVKVAGAKGCFFVYFRFNLAFEMFSTL